MRSAGMAAATPRGSSGRVPPQWTIGGSCGAQSAAAGGAEEDQPVWYSPATPSSPDMGRSPEPSTRAHSSSPDGSSVHTHGSTPLVSRQSTSYPSERLGEGERCSVCSKADVWTLVDHFQAMDRRGAGAICRGDFVWALSALGHTSVDFLRTLHRGRLSAYFHETAQDLQLDELLRRTFYGAVAEDVARMRRWTAARIAHNLLEGRRQSATDAELRRAFALLADESGVVPVAELVRARILTLEEALPVTVAVLDADTFCRLILQPEAAMDMPPQRDALGVHIGELLEEQRQHAAGGEEWAAPVPAATPCPPRSPPAPGGGFRRATLAGPPGSTRRSSSAGTGGMAKENGYGFVRQYMMLRAATMRLAN